MSKKELYFIANWKLNKGKKETLEFLSSIKERFNANPKLICAITPINIALDAAFMALPKGLKLCAQNVFYEEKGAFTGECSAPFLKEIGVSYCLVGHSERRRLFFESNLDVALKAQSLFKAGITPIICVGETFQERQEGLLEKVLLQQILPVLEKCEIYAKGGLIFAYEPVWAIGTGISATPIEVEKAHKIIKEYSNKIKVLYGGSVTLENVDELCQNPFIDGVLVGGASLQVSSFLGMIEKLSQILL